MYKNGIYGAVIGDICGSKMEVDEIRNRKTPLISQQEELYLKMIINSFKMICFIQTTLFLLSPFATPFKMIKILKITLENMELKKLFQ